MGILNVTQYRVGTNRSRNNVNAPRFFLILTGNSVSGLVAKAKIYFLRTEPSSIGLIIDSGALLIGTLSDRDFQYWYDILRNEKPIKLTYLVSNDPSPVVRFDHLSIGTSAEGVGEGPKDPDSL